MTPFVNTVYAISHHAESISNSAHSLSTGYLSIIRKIAEVLLTIFAYSLLWAFIIISVFIMIIPIGAGIFGALDEIKENREIRKKKGENDNESKN